MACSCNAFNPDHVRTVGSLKVNVLALRKALGGRPEIVQAMEAKASGFAGVNPTTMWTMFTSSVYASGDLPVLATREALQNSVDAIRAGVRARKTRAGEGRFSVTWDPSKRALTWEDNGIGMDERTILDKFLYLGESGKGDAADSSEAAGGFGVAKAVILGISPTFRWELLTRDNRAVANGFRNPVEIFPAPFLQGTRITVYDVSPTYDERYVREQGARLPILERLRHALAANDLPEIELLVNGESVKPYFSRRGGASVALGGSWGAGTTARVKAYRRGVGDRNGAYYVRLNGLFQFGRPSQRANLRADVVIDLHTSVRPGDPEYPLTAARDTFQRPVEYTFLDLVEEVERESISTGRDMEDEVIDPETDDTEDGMELAASTRAAFADAEFQTAMSEAAGGLADFLAAEAKVNMPRRQDSSAPAGTKAVESRLPGLDRVPEDAAGMLRHVLGEADRAAGGTVLDAAAAGALEQLAAGAALTASEALAIAHAAERATEAAIDPGGGGLMQVVQVQKAVQAIERFAPLPQQPRNPFGKFAGIRVSKKHYDRARARRFKKNYEKWIPYLTVWDATLRLIAAEAQIRRRFKPGFVLSDNIVGMVAAPESGAPVIYIQPDRFAEYAKAHRERPLALAVFLQQIAAHELAHLERGGGEGHDQEFVSTREDLGRSTAHLVPVLAVLCSKVLRLPVKESPEQQQIRALQRHLARAKDNTAEAKHLRVQLDRAEAARAAAVEEAARLQRATVVRSCPDCVRRVEQVIDLLREHPPAGLSPRRLERFVSRYRAEIAELVEEHDRRAGGAA